MNKRQRKEMESDYVSDDESSDDDSTYSNSRIHHVRVKHKQNGHLERKHHHNTKKSLNMFKDSQPPLKKRRRNKDEETSDDNSSVSNTRVHHDRKKQREHHNTLERKRRQDIKDSFIMLRNAVPKLREQPGRVSRAQVLKGSSNHIIDLDSKVTAGELRNLNLKNENIYLENKIKELEMMEANPQKNRQSLNGSSSVSNRRLIVPSSLSIKGRVNNSSDSCSTNSGHCSSVQINARNANTALFSYDYSKPAISSDLNNTINDDSSSSSDSESEDDNESAYSDSANIECDSWNFTGVGLDFENTETVFDLNDILQNYLNVDYDKSLSEIDLEIANNSSRINSPQMYDISSSNAIENFNGKVDVTSRSRRLVRVDSEDNESSSRNEDSYPIRSKFIKANYDDDNFSCGFDIHSFKLNPVSEDIPNYEESVDFTFDANFIELDNLDAGPKPSKMFSK